MTWCNDSHELDHASLQIIADSEKDDDAILRQTRALTCPSCGHIFELRDSAAAGIQDLPGLPAGVKFDPSDTEILEHLEAKVSTTSNHRLHPLIHEFIPTLDGENGICSTHPEGLPAVSKDGQVRHFFHRPSKAYTTGTRKRRKVHTDLDGSETRWHKTGKTRPVFVNKTLKGFKKILVLYTNYGRKRKPEKTNWVMHQYHLGNNEEERDGELVVSKVFYQTQPRQCGSSITKEEPTLIVSKKSKMGIGHEMQYKGSNITNHHPDLMMKNGAPNFLDYYHPSPTQFMSYGGGGGAIGGGGGGGGGGSQISRENQMMPSLVVQGDVSSFIHSSSHHFKQGEA